MNLPVWIPVIYLGITSKLIRGQFLHMPFFHYVAQNLRVSFWKAIFIRFSELVMVTCTQKVLSNIVWVTYWPLVQVRHLEIDKKAEVQFSLPWNIFAASRELTMSFSKDAKDGSLFCSLELMSDRRILV